MDNQPCSQHIELTDYDFSQMRKAAYARYLQLEEDLKARHEHEAQWDATHRLGPVARWFVNGVRHIKDTFDEDDIQDALSVYNPMEGFCRWKAQRNHHENTSKELP